MKTLLTFYIGILILFTSKDNNFDMGMYYYLIPETETDCTNEFPTGLSYFFEQVGGYGDYSTVSQLEKELNIDLSLFQNIFNENESDFSVMEEYGEIQSAEKEFKKHKEETRMQTESMLELVKEFKNKLNENEDFTNEIKFNSNLILPKNIRNLYPPEIEYYENGEFIKDLNYLMLTLECYIQYEVKYLRLGYA